MDTKGKTFNDIVRERLGAELPEELAGMVDFSSLGDEARGFILRLLAHMRDAMFPQMLEQMTSMIQRPIDLVVDWTQVTSACRLGSLMTQVGHVMGGLSVVAYDDAYSDHLTARIQRVRVTHAASASCTVADGEMILGIDLDVADGLGGFESMQLGDELKRWLA